MLDALSRRVRFAPPNPIEKRVIPQEKDKLIYRALDQHGPLPTHYLHAFVGGKYANFQVRLRKLFDFGYLIRPPEYFESIFAKYQSIVYDLGPKAPEPTIKRNDHAIHRLMTACVLASIELACNETVKFIPRDEVTGGQPMRLQLKKKVLIPDAVFGLHLTDKKQKHYYMVEIDRGTEKMASDYSRQTLEDKFTAYREVFLNQLYFHQWGRKNMHLLTVTTSEGRANTMRSLVPEDVSNRYHFKVYENFASPWRMPPVYTDILEGI